MRSRRAAGPVKEKAQEGPAKEPLSELTVSRGKLVELMKSTNQSVLRELHEVKDWMHIERRRASNEVEYRGVLQDYYDRERELIKAALSEVLHRSAVSQGAYDAALRNFGNDRAIALIRENFKKQISSSTQAPQDLSVEKLSEILNFQFALLEQVAAGSEWIDSAVEMAKIDDRVYQEYGFEAGEIIVAATQHQEELKPVLRKLVRKQNSLARK